MAVTPFQMKVKCNNCGGDGQLETINGTITCPDCSGTSWLFSGQLDGAEQIADLTDKVNDCIDKLDDILEKLNE